MAKDELNQSSRRDFLARVAKTGALVAPVIATFALTSNSPVKALPTQGGAVAGNGGGGPIGGNGGGGDQSFGDLNYRLPKPQSDLPDTR
jgi:hypothetical protein